MAKMSEKELLARDAKRNIAAEIRRGMQEVRAGRAARVHHIKVPEALEAQLSMASTDKSGQSQCTVSVMTRQWR